ncbi:MAG TPA: hypothetical protein VHB72_01600 [Candidatus Saccharimonadales bacterium]|nr:hypothetical protein [Candidatus Saccharimonadales bacterium]
MIRAVFFDFYSVWTPDVFSEHLEEARRLGPAYSDELESIVAEYFSGKITAADVAEAFRVKLNRPDIDTNEFTINESDISPAVGDFMRSLHGHFLKLGVLANLGAQEYNLLVNFNNHNPLFEVITGPLQMGLSVPLLTQEVFAKALQAIGEPPRSCLVVSGHPEYLSFAEELGIAALPFEGMPKLRQTLDQILKSEIPGA